MFLVCYQKLKYFIVIFRIIQLFFLHRYISTFRLLLNSWFTVSYEFAIADWIECHLIWFCWVSCCRVCFARSLMFNVHFLDLLWNVDWKDLSKCVYNIGIFVAGFHAFCLSHLNTIHVENNNNKTKVWGKSKTTMCIHVYLDAILRTIFLRQQNVVHFLLAISLGSFTMSKWLSSL